MTNEPDDSSGTASTHAPVRSEVPFDGDEPAMEIVEAVASASGVTPAKVSPRLSDVVEPDALGRLFGPRSTARRRSDGRVRFQWSGWDVEVDWRDQHVRVYETDES